MPQTLPDILVDGDSYTELYAESSIATGTPILIENKGATPVRIYEGGSEPSLSNTDGVLLFPGRRTTIPSGSLEIWARCTSSGRTAAISVRENSRSQILFNNANADGDSSEFIPNGSTALVIIRGDTFTGTTVTLQMQSANDPSSRWRDMTNGSFTEATEVPMENIPEDVRIRANLVIGTGSNIFVEIQQPCQLTL